MRLSLLRRNGSFFSLFVEQRGVLQNLSRLLVEESRICDQNVCDFASQVLELEHRGDALIRDVLTHLNRGLSTTLEPDDVRQLASRLDDDLDEIEEVSNRIAAYRVTPLPSAAARLSEIFDGSGLLINDAVKALGGNGGVPDLCGKISQVEREADTLVRCGLTELLQRNSDAIIVIKLKEIYQLLESTVDRCEDVADALQNIAVRNC
jgi:uncharacterized protein Yka (UPF0111/DUF47 family)